MKPIYCICFCLSTLFAKAQYNYVTNGSFEDLLFCPTAQGQVTVATGWSEPTQNWGALANTCLNSVLFLPKYSTLPIHYQLPFNGNGTGVFVGYNGIGNDYRTYLQNMLKLPLVANKCYYVSFWVNYLDPVTYGIRNISLNFTSTAISSTGTGNVLNLPEHIYKFGKPSIDDTLNWVEISGIYVANGTEQYLTIGNFRDDANTDTVRTTYSFNYPGAEYFCDDVKVIPIDSIIGGMPANAGKDTNVVIGDSVFVGQEITNLNCNWFILGGAQIATNTSGIFVKPVSTTTYVVEQTLCGTITYDTVMVIVVPTALQQYNLAQNNVLIYPNPATDILNIEFLNFNNETYAIDILNTVGQVLLSKTTTTKNVTLKTSNLSSGAYIVKITNTGSQQQISKKLIIE